MKVIKSGDGRKGWAKEFKCTGAGNGNGGCGATLLVEEGDLYETKSTDYGGSTEIFTTFRCPECKNETDVKVPSSVNVRRSEKSCDNDWR